MNCQSARLQIKNGKGKRPETALVFFYSSSGLTFPSFNLEGEP